MTAAYLYILFMTCSEMGFNDRASSPPYQSLDECEQSLEESVPFFEQNCLDYSLDCRELRIRNSPNDKK